jgi:CheY-like chemotaxis protein
LILHQQLSSWGMQPDEEAGGYAALARMRAASANQHGYDIVVLDLNMPEMDGLELAQRIGSEPDIAAAKLFLLSSSGKVSDEVARECRLSGALAKPVRQSELFNCLVTGLGGSSPQPTAVTANRTAIAHSEPARRHGHILLVEDNAMNQLVATKILEKLGYTVEVAENGREALEAIAGNSVAGTAFDAVLMDCQMPEMDGYEATRQLRRLEGDDGRRLPVIAMTAAAMDGDRERCLAAGMDDYVTKPVRSVAVDSVLAQWIDGREPVAAITPADLSEIESPLDPDRLALLRELDGGDGELLSAVVSEFVDDSERQLTAVSAGLIEGDPHVVERAVHSLKGASANLGATTLADLCGELEALARAAALGMAPDLLDSIRAEHVRVCSALDIVRSEG